MKQDELRHENSRTFVEENLKTSYKPAEDLDDGIF